ncbi:MAG: 16S rRNA (adenine(1518)-N(6)/adenine(1519)-N(6))-dimethyltransferase RsmA [Candidatus Omnitrophota bacterium]
MLTATELKSILSRHGITPRKYLGQNFLVDKNMAAKIVEACELSADDLVLEIGPGLGALTQRISSVVNGVVAVEKDRAVCAALGGLIKDSDNIELICGDFLKLDMEKIFIEAQGKIKVIGNLPYYITTPIIEKLILSKDRLEAVFITVQREVAHRLCAKPGSKDYGSISCFVQFHTNPSILFEIDKHVFYPQPEVNSSFLRLSILEKPPVQVNNTEKFFGVIRSAFGKRRKTILNSLLYSEFIDIDKAALASLLRRLELNPLVRPEDLSLEEFARIANSLTEPSINNGHIG